MNRGNNQIIETATKNLPIYLNHKEHVPSEIQPTFIRAVQQCLHPAVNLNIKGVKGNVRNIPWWIF